MNLYAFRDVASYPEGSAQGSDPSPSGPEAIERFGVVMLPLLVRHASHPVFSTRGSDAGTSRWDRLVIVRYRSRRDIAEIFATDAFADASAHKWAALAGHERLLVQGLQLPALTLPLALLSGGSLWLAIVVQRRRPRSA